VLSADASVASQSNAARRNLKPPGFMHPRGGLAGHVLGLSFGLDRWDTAKPVREALLVAPGDVVGGDKFNIGESAQRPAVERRVSANAFVF
jgi:hypothetical protein